MGGTHTTNAHSINKPSPKTHSNTDSSDDQAHAWPECSTGTDGAQCAAAQETTAVVTQAPHVRRSRRAIAFCGHHRHQRRTRMSWYTSGVPWHTTSSAKLTRAGRFPTRDTLRTVLTMEDNLLSVARTGLLRDHGTPPVYLGHRGNPHSYLRHHGIPQVYLEHMVYPLRTWGIMVPS